MERRKFFARAATAGAALPIAGAAALAGAGPALTDLDVQVQLDATGTVELPPGEIVVYQGLRVPSRTILRGAGMRTVLRAAPGLTTPVIRFVQPEGLVAEREIQGCGVENLTVHGPGDTPVGIDYGADPAVPSSNPRSCWIRGVRVEGFQAGIRVSYAEGGHFQDCKLIYNSTGILVGDAAAGLQLTHCDFRHNGNALHVRAARVASNEWAVVRCHFESNAATGVTLAGAQTWTFLRCKWEGNAAHLVLDSPDVTNVSLRPDGHQFIAGSFNKTSSGGPGISVNQGTRLIFQGCTASAGLAQALVLKAG